MIGGRAGSGYSEVSQSPTSIQCAWTQPKSTLTGECCPRIVDLRLHDCWALPSKNSNIRRYDSIFLNEKVAQQLLLRRKRAD
jgi:hypothetical protein